MSTEVYLVDENDEPLDGSPIIVEDEVIEKLQQKADRLGVTLEEVMRNAIVNGIHQLEKELKETGGKLPNCDECDCNDCDDSEEDGDA